MLIILQCQSSRFYRLVKLFLPPAAALFLISYLVCLSMLLHIGTWRAWCCQLARTWGIYKSEKYIYNWTRKIWNWYMVLLPLPTRIQWLFKAVLLWVLSQFHEAQRTTSEAYGELCLYRGVCTLFCLFFFLPFPNLLDVAYLILLCKLTGA